MNYGRIYRIKNYAKLLLIGVAAFPPKLPTGLAVMGLYPISRMPLVLFILDIGQTRAARQPLTPNIAKPVLFGNAMQIEAGILVKIIGCENSRMEHMIGHIGHVIRPELHRENHWHIKGAEKNCMGAN